MRALVRAVREAILLKITVHEQEIQSLIGDVMAPEYLRKELSVMVNRGILLRVGKAGEQYTAGPNAQEWYDNPPKTADKAKGNSTQYKIERVVREAWRRRSPQVGSDARNIVHQPNPSITVVRLEEHEHEALITVQQAAAIQGCSVNSIRHRIYRGYLPIQQRCKHGRVLVSLKAITELTHYAKR